MALKPEELPRLTEGDLTPSVIAALTRAGFKTKLLEKCSWSTAAELGTAYPAMIPMQDGSWLILILTVVKDAGPMAAVLDPEREAEGIQIDVMSTDQVSALFL